MKNLADDGALAQDGGIKRCFTAMRRNLRHWELKGRAISSASERSLENGDGNQRFSLSGIRDAQQVASFRRTNQAN